VEGMDEGWTLVQVDILGKKVFFRYDWEACQWVNAEPVVIRDEDICRSGSEITSLRLYRVREGELE
jgi:hypothetical protein